MLANSEAVPTTADMLVESESHPQHQGPCKTEQTLMQARQNMKYVRVKATTKRGDCEKVRIRRM